MARPHRRRGRRSHRSHTNLYTGGPLVNVHRRRSRPRKRKYFSRLRSYVRRHFRHRLRARTNKRIYRRERGLALAGIHFPPLDAVLWVGTGLVVPPLITAQIMKFVPDTWKQSAATTWLVKIASVVVPGILLRRFVNPRAGNLYMVGGLASLVLDAIRTYAPGILPGMGYQPLLGAYFDSTLPAQRPRAMLPPMIAEAPTRLDPQHRF